MMPAFWLRFWYVIIVINLLLLSLWLASVLLSLPPTLSVLLTGFVGLALSMLQMLGVTAPNTALWNWSDSLTKNRWQQAVIAILSTGNLIGSALIIYRTILPIQYPDPELTLTEQFPVPIAPDLKSAIWQPLPTSNLQFEALLRGTTLQLEGHKLINNGTLTEVQQKWLAAIDAYRQANDEDSIANIYQHLAVSYGIEAMHDLKKIRLQLGYASQVDYMLHRNSYREKLQMFRSINLKQIDQADSSYEKAWKLFQEEKCDDAFNEFFKAKRLYESTKSHLDVDQIEFLMFLCSHKPEELQKWKNDSKIPTFVKISTLPPNRLSQSASAAEQLLKAREIANSDKWQATVDIYKITFEAFEALGNTFGFAQITHELANIYFIKGDYSEAQNWYEDALTSFNKLQDNYNQAIVHHNLELANTLGSIPNYGKAAVEFDTDIQLWNKTLAEPLPKLYSLHGYGFILWKQGNLAQAIDIFYELQEKELQVWSSDSPKIKGDILTHLGILYFTQKRYEEALEVFENARTEYNSSSDAHKKIESLFNVGLTQEKQENFDDARQTYEQVVDLANKANLSEIKMSANDRIVSIQQQLTGQQDTYIYLWSLRLLLGATIILITLVLAQLVNQADLTGIQPGSALSEEGKSAKEDPPSLQ